MFRRIADPANHRLKEPGLAFNHAVSWLSDIAPGMDVEGATIEGCIGRSEWFNVNLPILADLIEERAGQQQAIVSPTMSFDPSAPRLAGVSCAGGRPAENGPRGCPETIAEGPDVFCTLDARGR